MKYSIVIPAHNEEEKLGSFASCFIDDLTNRMADVEFEFIIVENGSTDHTLEVAQRLEAKYSRWIRVFSNERGSYGEAIKRGILESEGAYLSILECDLLDAEFVNKSIQLFRADETRIIVGSKRHPESLDSRPLKRRILTLLFNSIIKICLRYPGSDTHGLKSIEKHLAKRLCELALTTDEIFQTEIVLIAWRMGEDIVELPLRIEEVRATTVSIRRRFPMVIDLVQQLQRSMKRFPLRSSGTVRPRFWEISH
jgi:glycosyltransferase involved in cell wall biosynthesis